MLTSLCLAYVANRYRQVKEHDEVFADLLESIAAIAKETYRDFKEQSELKIVLIDKNCEPVRAYPTDSGLDLKARLDHEVVLQPYECLTVPVGIAIELPPGYEGQIRPRSGWSKAGLLAVYGTVDNGYRGELMVTLCNVVKTPHVIRPYDRIAQLVVAPVHIPKLVYVTTLSETERGSHGFGSTGVS
ncbi:dUTP diphosphatase [Caldanaerobius polysaccharolyticus]|uniref:dUTP diphosphatase n=1 Tax=Caldanaerobius polysaccharolyticus TaxID=44256 RepID=UPI001C54EC3A|nr:dUTP diphosphatase [Caldanaerobius polysaccharolyticus]